MELSRVIALAFFVLLAAGCATRSDTTAQAEPQAKPEALADEYRIGVDDQLQVSVWRNDDISVSVPVRPDGMISVPLIGDVQAGGRTPAQVAGTVEEKLKRYIREPQVTVIVTELRSHEFLNRVRVTGAVEDPITLPYRQGMTILDLVLEAGGVTEFAAPNHARLYRRTADGTQVMDIKLDRILSRGELATNHYLMPGDIVTVPERLF